MSKLVMGYWDCPVCGNKGIRGDVTNCPSCGRARGDVKFYVKGYTEGDSLKASELSQFEQLDDKKAEEIETDFSNLTQKFVLHMPVSISYEFQHVIIDARYVYGLTRSFKSSFGKSNNSMLMFTVGYRFNL